MARRARSGDLDSLEELAREALGSLRPGRGRELLRAAARLDEHDLKGSIDALLRDERTIVASCFFGGAPAGFAIAHVGEGATSIITLAAVYVTPAFREVGLGEALVEVVRAAGEAQGALGIDALALPGDREQKALFETLGLTARLLVMHQDVGDERPGVRCVGAVIVEDRSILLIRRGHAPDEGRWSLPGGRVHPDEHPTDAVAREVAEETGVAVEVGPALGDAVLAGPNGERYLVTDYLATRLDPNVMPVAATDAADARFVPLDALGGLDLSRGLFDWLVDHGVLDGV